MALIRRWDDSGRQEDLPFVNPMRSLIRTSRVLHDAIREAIEEKIGPELAKITSRRIINLADKYFQEGEIELKFPKYSGETELFLNVFKIEPGDDPEKAKVENRICFPQIKGESMYVQSLLAMLLGKYPGKEVKVNGPDWLATVELSGEYFPVRYKVSAGNNGNGEKQESYIARKEIIEVK